MVVLFCIKDSIVLNRSVCLKQMKMSVNNY